ncbi:MAG: RluA family pseudouridine synthase [Candidatus Krumholzibacteria bacterium]|nr:RluA family pseudouridine synthase [Candidatus Krumholzibacteria bacterium]
MNDRRHFSFLVDEEGGGERLDRYLSEQMPKLSRSRIQKAVRAGDVLVDGETAVKPSSRVHMGECIELAFSPPRQPEICPEEIPIDIVYEDDYLLVVNKQAGMVVHPAPGHESGTLVHALLAHCKDLSGIGGVLRPGIVHRLDGGTSGLLVVAKSDEVHIALSRQLMKREVKRVYLALVWGEMPSSSGTIDLPVGRSPRDRKKMAVVPVRGREAVTSYYVLDTFKPFQYTQVKLGTGRTHQIRVHLSHIGHPVLGDSIYGGRRIRRGALSKKEFETAGKALSLIERQALHAGELSFVHPETGEEITCQAPLPADFRSVLELLGE